MSGAGPLTERWQPASIDGVWQRTLTFHDDERGSFAEMWRERWMTEIPGRVPAETVQQANLSRSQARVLRGLHAHERQADVWVIVAGHPFVALVDLRQAIASGAPVAIETIDAGPGSVLYLPAGVAHGFYATDALTMFYLVTNEFDGSDEHGFAWDDPDAGVPWPDRSPILSPRDAAAGSLAALLASLRPGNQHNETR